MEITILSTLKTWWSWCLVIKICICITTSKFRNKFTWAMDRDIQLNSPFWPLFECILQIPLDWRPLKNQDFCQHILMHVINDIYYWSHLNSCLTVLKNPKKLKNDRTPSFLGTDLPRHSTLCTSIFLASYAKIWWALEWSLPRTTILVFGSPFFTYIIHSYSHRV